MRIFTLRCSSRPTIQNAMCRFPRQMSFLSSCLVGIPNLKQTSRNRSIHTMLTVQFSQRQRNNYHILSETPFWYRYFLNPRISRNPFLRSEVAAVDWLRSDQARPGISTLSRAVAGVGFVDVGVTGDMEPMLGFSSSSSSSTSRKLPRIILLTLPVHGTVSTMSSLLQVS